MKNDLFTEFVSATGLPTEMIGRELNRFIHRAGFSAESLTLEDLRVILADYLQDVLTDALTDALTAAAEDPSVAQNKILEIEACTPVDR